MESEIRTVSSARHLKPLFLPLPLPLPKHQDIFSLLFSLFIIPADDVAVYIHAPSVSQRRLMPYLLHSPTGKKGLCWLVLSQKVVRLPFNDDVLFPCSPFAIPLRFVSQPAKLASVAMCLRWTENTTDMSSHALC